MLNIAKTSTIVQFQIQSSSDDGNVDMSVVIMTTDAFLPSSVEKIPESENKAAVLDTLWDDLEGSFGGDSEMHFINSIILEIAAEGDPTGLAVDFFVKPNFQVVNIINARIIFHQTYLLVIFLI